MKRFLLRLLALAVIAAAAGPTALSQYRLWRGAQAVDAYLEAVQALDPLAESLMLVQARQYNAAMDGIAVADPFTPDGAPDGGEGYAALLDPAGGGVMAALEIPKLGATLPVYHGTGEAALRGGAGHLAGTSLPVGGDGAVTVLAAERGGLVPGPFAGLDRLIPGDYFTLRALDETLVYQVAQVAVVEPRALEAALAGDGGDACVLMTTKPYGSDTQRLLVLARRVARRAALTTDDTQLVPGWGTRLILAAPVAAAGWLLAAVVGGLCRAARKRRLRRVRL